jgi:hypothetical protein
MFPTVEVRWFYKGVMPDDIMSKILPKEQELTEQPLRKDHYYCDTSSSMVGIKIREGRIEIKSCSNDYGNVKFNKQIEGRVEHWQKWSFNIEETDLNYRDVLEAASSWIGVTKERKLCRYRICDNRLSILSENEYSEMVCHFELTNIIIRGADWWSLAFEAYGEGSSLFDNLVRTVKHVFSDVDLPLFKVNDSFSYPKWLELYLKS